LIARSNFKNNKREIFVCKQIINIYKYLTSNIKCLILIDCPNKQIFINKIFYIYSIKKNVCLSMILIKSCLILIVKCRKKKS